MQKHTQLPGEYNQKKEKDKKKNRIYNVISKKTQSVLDLIYLFCLS